VSALTDWLKILAWTPLGCGSDGTKHAGDNCLSSYGKAKPGPKH
jgi:hypothetical protein